MTIAELYEEYYEYQKATYTYGTWYPRVNLIKNHALPYIGDKDVDKATSDDIDNIYDKMEDRGLMQNTIFGMQAALILPAHIAHRGVSDHLFYGKMFLKKAVS